MASRSAGRRGRRSGRSSRRPGPPGGGPLGASFDPFRLVFDPATGTRVPALELPPDLTPERMTDRAALLAGFGRAESRAQELGAAGALDEYRARALALL